jgi:hypothetical protein
MAIRLAAPTALQASVGTLCLDQSVAKAVVLSVAINVHGRAQEALLDIAVLAIGASSPNGSSGT